MKKIIRVLIVFMSIVSLTACTKETENIYEPEKIHDNIADENIDYVSISGNARSIVLRRSENKCFEFYNGDLNNKHIYKIDCDENKSTLDVDIIMENMEDDNNILGSVYIDIPQKEFEKIEITGNFDQIFLHTMNSDVSIDTENSFVNLNLESDYLKHDITLGGSESSDAHIFNGVSLYFDQFPPNVGMELNTIQGGMINDPEKVLAQNGLEAGAGKPVIRINNAKEINIYRDE